jgi:hypothetical protein
VCPTEVVILSAAKNLAFPDRCKTLHFAQGDGVSKKVGRITEILLVKKYINYSKIDELVVSQDLPQNAQKAQR